MSPIESPKTDAATSRLASAIKAAETGAATKTTDSDTGAATPAVRRSPRTSAPTHAGRTSATRDAARGAAAAPDHRATGANAAGDGADQVRDHAPTPAEASMDSYVARAAATGAAPNHADAYAAAVAASEGSGAVSGGGDVARSEAASGAAQGGWSEQWRAEFEALQLAPTDIEYLASSGFSHEELAKIAGELAGVDTLEAPTPGVDAGNAASADAPVESAWSPQWAQRFTDVMGRMGMSQAEIRAQLDGVEDQPLTQEQLQAAYDQMDDAVGAFDDQWRDKISKLLDELDTPAAEQQQVLDQLAGSGMTEAQLNDVYSQLEKSRPAWSEDWQYRFQSLELPDDIVNQIKDSKGGEEQLQMQYDQLLDLKMEYHEDGRLEKLKDAGADESELWGVMLQGMKGEEFDKTVEQIHSKHVPAWKRIGSFALNLVPGAYAVQFVLGKDLLTGEKIDRTNPLNIVGAVASGFAGFTAIRSGLGIVQGLQGANAAAQATKAAAGGAALADAVTGTSALSQGSLKAMQAASLVDKFDKGLRFSDYLKAATPIVNRFGEAGRLSSFGRGYYQSMQLTAGMASLKAVEGGGAAIDPATKSKVLEGLKQGKSVDDALAAAGRTTGTGGGYSLRAQDVIRDSRRYGFLQGGVGKAGEGNRIMRGTGNFTFNPFKNNATIAETATDGVFSLGRGVNFGTNGGLAQGIGAIRGANSVSTPALAAQAATRTADANHLLSSAKNAQNMAGVGIADDVQRIETLTKTAEWSNRLGVTGGGRFRTLMQLGTPSGRAAQRVTGMVENGGETAYRVGRHIGVGAARYAGYATSGTIAGSAIGIPMMGTMGTQMQPAWDYWKDRKEIRAEEAAQAEIADQEAAELERLYAENEAARAGGGAPAPTPTATAPGTLGTNADGTTGPVTTAVPTEPQLVGTSPTGGQLVYFPADGIVVDQGNGDVYDPQSGTLIGNLVTGQQAADPYAAQAATVDPYTPQASGPAPAAATTAPAGEVYVDPATGYYVDPTTGLMADPVSGQVFDQSGALVGNVNDQAAA